MGLLKRKIPRGTILLFISFFAISVCCMTILGAMRLDRLNKLQSRKYYSDKARKFSIQNCKKDDFWEHFLAEEKAEGLALYTTVWDDDFDVRALYGSGDFPHPPLLSGSFSDFGQTYGKEKIAVVGKNFEKDLVEKGKKRYFNYRGQEFEVCGIVGTEQDSRANNTVYIDLASGLSFNTLNTSYLVDGNSSRRITHFLQALETNIAGIGNIAVAVEDTDDGIGRLFSDQKMTQTLYGLILLSFLLSAVIVASLWLSYKENSVAVKRMLGYRTLEIVFDVGKSYLITAGMGYLSSLPVLFIVTVNDTAITFAWIDLMFTLLITVCFGILALILPLSRLMQSMISKGMR